MNWKPLSEVELWEDINQAFDRMSPEQQKVWEAIKICPEKWSESTYGKEGGGFWVVAIIGGSIIWYNDIEHGYNQSTYKIYGVINEYWCNQDELEWAVQSIIDILKTGYDSGGRCGPPQSIA